MTQLMAIDENRARQLNEKLEKTMFRSVSDFISFYNSGIINRKNDEVVSYAKEIVETFKNVKEKSGNFYFISAQEINVEEILNIMKEWDVLVKVKRSLSEHLSDETVISSDTLYVDSEYLDVFIRKDENEGVLFSMKPLLRGVSINEVHSSFSSLGNDMDENSREIFMFKVSDFTDRDVSFIDNMRRLIPRV